MWFLKPQFHLFFFFFSPKIFDIFLPLFMKYKAQQQFPEKVSLILCVIVIISLHCTLTAFVPKIAPAVMLAVSGRKTYVAILALPHKICVKSQRLRSSHNLSKITVTAVKYALWKHSKAIFCLGLLQGGRKDACSLLKDSGALWGSG